MSAGERGQIAAILKKNNSHDIPLSEILAKLVGWIFLMLHISTRIIFHFLLFLTLIKPSFLQGCDIQRRVPRTRQLSIWIWSQGKFYLSIRRVKGHKSEYRHCCVIWETQLCQDDRHHKSAAGVQNLKKIFAVAGAWSASHDEFHPWQPICAQYQVSSNPQTCENHLFCTSAKLEFR